MGRTTGGGDNYFEAAVGCGGGVFKKAVGRAVCGDNLCLKGNFEVLELFGSVLHGFPVGLAAHDNADQRFLFFDHSRDMDSESSHRAKLETRYLGCYTYFAMTRLWSKKR